MRSVTIILISLYPIKFERNKQEQTKTYMDVTAEESDVSIPVIFTEVNALVHRAKLQKHGHPKKLK